MNNDIENDYKALLEGHKNSLKALEQMLHEFDVEKVSAENTELRASNKQLVKDYNALKQHYSTVEKEYANLKAAYLEIQITEKAGFLETSKNKMNRLFRDAENRRVNRLEKLEQDAGFRLNQLEGDLSDLSESLVNQYKEEFADLRERLGGDVEARKAEISEASRLAVSDNEALYEAEQTSLRETVTDVKDTMTKAFEFKWGLNVLNKVGVLLIFIAVVLAGKYTVTNFLGDYAKGIAFYLLGGLFMGAGEYMKRKKYGPLAMALMGGGIGILYIATFVSTFFLGILGLLPALGISVAIAAVSILISLAYKSESLGALSLVGGYLPVFAYVGIEGIEALPVMGAVAYLLILNGVILGLSVKNHWKYLIWIGFVFNMLCVDPLLFMITSKPIAIAVAILNFSTYLVIVLRRYLTGMHQTLKSDLVLLSLNTLGHVGFIYGILNWKASTDINGLIGIGFGALYLALGVFLDKRSQRSTLSSACYFLAAGFSILVVPLQLDLEWWTFGWLIEAVFFIWWGINSDSKIVKTAGWVLLLLSTVLFHTLYGISYKADDVYPSLTDAKYLGHVIAFLAVFWITREGHSMGLKLFRYLAPLYTLAFVFIQTRSILAIALDTLTLIESASILAVLVAVMLFALKAFQYEEKYDVHSLNPILKIILLLVIMNSNFSYNDLSDIREVIEIVSIMLLNAYAVLLANQLFRSVAAEKFRIPHAAKSLVLGLYMLFAFFINDLIRLHTSFDNLIHNSALIVFSLGYILYGFARNDGIFRRMGLIISFLATAKLLIIDSMALSLTHKIISYFAFGVSLMVISYVYQRAQAKWLTEVDSETAFGEAIEKEPEND